MTVLKKRTHSFVGLGTFAWVCAFAMMPVQAQAQAAQHQVQGLSATAGPTTRTKFKRLNGRSYDVEVERLSRDRFRVTLGRGVPGGSRSFEAVVGGTEDCSAETTCSGGTTVSCKVKGEGSCLSGLNSVTCLKLETDGSTTPSGGAC